MELEVAHEVLVLKLGGGRLNFELRQMVWARKN
jgi:hypothetical protein